MGVDVGEGVGVDVVFCVGVVVGVVGVNARAFACVFVLATVVPCRPSVLTLHPALTKVRTRLVPSLTSFRSIGRTVRDKRTDVAV